MAADLEPIDIEINMRQNVGEESGKASQGMSDMTDAFGQFDKSVKKSEEELKALTEHIRLQREVLGSLEEQCRTAKKTLDGLDFELGNADAAKQYEEAKRLLKEINAELNEQREYIALLEAAQKKANITKNMGDVKEFNQGWDSVLTTAAEYANAIQFQKEHLKNLNVELLKTKDDAKQLQGVINSIQSETPHKSQKQSEYRDLIAKSKELAATIKDEEDGLKKLTKGYDDLKKQQAKNVTNIEKEITILTQIRKIREEMATLVNKDGTVSPENLQHYEQLKTKLGEVGTAYRKIQEEQKLLTTKGNAQLAGLIQGISGLSGAFTVGQGFLSLFIKDNEKLAAIQTKLQAVMSITIGLQAASSALHHTSAFRIATVTKATQLWNRAQTVLNTSLGIGAGLSKAFISGGIMLLVVAIGYLITKYQDWRKEQEQLKQLQQEELKVYREANNSIKEQVVRVETLEKVLKNSNKTYTQRNNALNELKSIMPEYNAQLTKEGQLIEDNTGSLKRYVKELKNTAFAKAAVDKLVQMQSQYDEWLDMINSDDEIKLIYNLSPEEAKASGDFIFGNWDNMHKAGEDHLKEIAKWEKKVEEYVSDNLGNVEDYTKEYWLQQQKNAQARLDVMKDYEKGSEKWNAAVADYNKATSKLRNWDIKGQNRDSAKEAKEADKLEKQQKNATDKLAKKSSDYQKRIDAARIAAMEDGAEKQRTAALAEFEETKRMIEQERKELDDLEKITGKPATEQRNSLNTLEKASEDKYNAEVKKINETSRKAIDEIFTDVNRKFRTELDNNLTSINKYYDEQIKKARESGATIEEINRLNAMREKETSGANIEDQIRKDDFNREIELVKLQGMESTGLTELYERKKLDITKKYAEQRLAMLNQLVASGREDLRQETEMLEASIGEIDRELSKPRKIKTVIDTKLFDKVKNHFKSLGQSEEEAQKSTVKFFESFSKGGQVALDVITEMQGIFGGMNEELDMALNAAANIAKGFAEGGLIGGIQQAAGQLISVTAGLLTAKKEVDKSMIEGYEAYIDAIDRLIDKQIESLKSLGAKGISETLNKTIDDLNHRLEASRRLFNEVGESGSGMFSHSLGYKANKMLGGYSAQLRQAGIYTTDIYKMTNEQLIQLRSMPEIWAHLHGDLRKYIDDMAAAKEELDGLDDQLKEIILGLDYSNITDAIVDSLTDPSIDNAMDSLEGKVDEMIGSIIKNIITKNMLVEPIQKMVKELWDTVDITDNGIKFDPAAMLNFKNKVMQQAGLFEDTWKEWEDMFAGMGINLSGNNDTETRQGTSAGLERISQDSANELNGNFYAIRQQIGDIRNLQKEANIMRKIIQTQLARIVENTEYCRLLENVKNSLEDMQTRGIKVKV